MPAQFPVPAQNDPPEPPPDPDPVEVRSDPEPVVAAALVPAGLDFPDPVHYPARDLDVYPQAVKPLTPAYPEAARNAQISGFVILQVLVDESGRVVGTSLVDAAPGGVFEQAAEKAVVDAVFYPARKDGRTVRSRILVKIEFEPTGNAP
jgi:TonB family protein